MSITLDDDFFDYEMGGNLSTESVVTTPSDNADNDNSFKQTMLTEELASVSSNAIIATETVTQTLSSLASTLPGCKLYVNPLTMLPDTTSSTSYLVVSISGSGPYSIVIFKNNQLKALASTTGATNIKIDREKSDPSTWTLGTYGWKISAQGNAIFSNLAVRGQITATSGTFEGYMSAGTFLIGKDVSGTNDGIYINSNNYWYESGNFSIGNGTNGVVWNGSTLAVTGQITATTGTIGGFTIGATSLTAGSGGNSVGLSTSGYPFYAGNATPSLAAFRVTSAGVLTATTANISGTINASAGNFTGYVTAGTSRFGANVQTGKDGLWLNATNYWYDDGTINATTGLIGGWTLGSTSLSGGSTTLNSNGVVTVGTSNDIAVMSSSDSTYRIWAGNAVASSAPFRVTKTGDMYATTGYIGGTSSGWQISSELLNSSYSTVVNKTASGVSGEFTIVVSSNTGLYVSMIASGGGIASGAYITLINGTTITLSLANTSTVSGTVSFTPNKIYLQNGTNPKITISNDTVGKGAHASATTPFYADSAGRFSLGDKLFFDPSDSQGFGTLTVIGRIRGAVENTPIVPEDSAVSLVGQIVVAGTAPNQTATISTLNLVTGAAVAHNFSVGDTVILGGISGTASALDGAWVVSSKTSTAFTITSTIDAPFDTIASATYTAANNRTTTTGTGSNGTNTLTVASSTGIQIGQYAFNTTYLPTGGVYVTYINGNVITLSSNLTGSPSGASFSFYGSGRVREMTIGLHAAKGGSPAGLGLRIDENNYWFVNNHFRVGTTGSYLQWDGTSLETSGIIKALAGEFQGAMTVAGGNMKFGKGVNGSNSGIYINTTNYWYDNGVFSVGGSNGITYNGTTVAIGSSVVVNGDISGASGTFSGSITIGSGESVFKADSNGIYLGSAIFANAEFSVTPAGLLKAISGSIGGWDISSNILSNNQIGLYAPSVTAFTKTLTTTAGSNSATVGTATSVAVGQSITSSRLPAGTYITGLSGTTITLSENAISSGLSTAYLSEYGIYAGNTTRELAPFKVDYYGNLSATSANISGTITALSGQIGTGTIWYIGNDLGNTGIIQSFNNLYYTPPSASGARLTPTSMDFYTPGSVFSSLGLTRISATNGFEVYAPKTMTLGNAYVVDSAKLATNIPPSGNITFRGAIDDGTLSNGKLLIESSNMDIGTVDDNGTLGVYTGINTSSWRRLAFDSNEIQASASSDSGVTWTLSGIQINALGGDITLGSSALTASTTIALRGLISIYRDSAIPLNINRATGTTAQAVVQFQRSGNNAGGINASTSTAPTFTSPSDYRLKENIQDYIGGIDVIKKTRPRTFSFINDEEHKTVVGFIAHEYDDVNPDFVIGEKDAIDEDGNPIYQSIETTSILPYLIAANKELIEKVEMLEQRLAILEG